ncbi:hypothetical protein Gotur_014953 [Gossypium turneri]
MPQNLGLEVKFELVMERLLEQIVERIKGEFYGENQESGVCDRKFFPFYFDPATALTIRSSSRSDKCERVGGVTLFDLKHLVRKCMACSHSAQGLLPFCLWLLAVLLTGSVAAILMAFSRSVYSAEPFSGVLVGLGWIFVCISASDIDSVMGLGPPSSVIPSLRRFGAMRELEVATRPLMLCCRLFI